MERLKAALDEPIPAIFGKLSHLKDIIKSSKLHIYRSRSFGVAGTGNAELSLTLISAAALTLISKQEIARLTTGVEILHF